MTEDKDLQEGLSATQEVQTDEATATTDEQEVVQAEPSVEDTIEKMRAEIDRLNDQLLRKMAEFENFRKRTLKEKTELVLNGGQKVIESLLPVLDDLERAQENMAKSDDVATLREGVDLIVSKLNKTLATHGLEKMKTSEVLFDTDFHEAIALVPVAEEEKKNHIIDCVQAGYTLNEKVIRHAKVVVGQ